MNSSSGKIKKGSSKRVVKKKAPSMSDSASVPKSASVKLKKKAGGGGGAAKKASTAPSTPAPSATAAPSAKSPKKATPAAKAAGDGDAAEFDMSDSATLRRCERVVELMSGTAQAGGGGGGGGGDDGDVAALSTPQALLRALRREPSGRASTPANAQARSANVAAAEALVSLIAASAANAVVAHAHRLLPALLSHLNQSLADAAVVPRGARAHDDDDDNELLLSARAVANLTASGATADDLNEAGVWSALKLLLHAGVDDARVTLYVLKAMRRLLADDANCLRCVRRRLVLPVAHAASTHAAEKPLVFEALGALALLCRVESSRARVVAARGAHVALSHAANDVSDGKLVARALDVAIRAACDAEGARAVAEAHGVLVALAVLRAESSAPVARHQAIALLGRLLSARDATAASEFVDADGLRVLAPWLVAAANARTDGVNTEVCVLLAHVAQLSAALGKRVRALDGLSPAMRAAIEARIVSGTPRRK